MVELLITQAVPQENLICFVEFVSADETLLHVGLDDVSCSLPSDVGAAVTQCSQHLELAVVATAANLVEEGPNLGQDPSVSHPLRAAHSHPSGKFKMFCISGETWIQVLQRATAECRLTRTPFSKNFLPRDNIACMDSVSVNGGSGILVLRQFV